MTASTALPPNSVALPRGLRWARLAGLVTGTFLLVTGVARLAGWTTPTLPGAAEFLAGLLLVVHGLLLTVPWASRTPARAFAILFGMLVATTLAFSFLQIAEAMFRIHRYAAEGRKPGLPAFQGTLVFLALLQVPTLLFVRRPDLLK